MTRAHAVLLLTIALLVAIGAAPVDAGDDASLQVGVLSGHGASANSYRNAFEALRIDAGMVPREITADEVLGGVLDELDALVLPGGSGSQQVAKLGELGADRVRRFVLEQGRGVVGLCAGAYMLSDTPDYLCLRLCGVAAVDREHDERGHGMIAFSITEQGSDAFPELAGAPIHHLCYYEGPLLVPAASAQPFEVLGRFQTDVHLENDAPAGIMPGKPVLVRAEAGQGRVFLSAGHPEATPGMRWMLPRMVRWTCRREPIAYTRAVVRPRANDHEILFDIDLRREEEERFQQLLYGSSDERIEAMQRLVAMRSWSAASQIAGGLRSEHADVRLAAAAALAELEATWATPEVATARTLAETPEERTLLDAAVARLRSMTPAVAPQPLPYAPARQVALTFDDLPVASSGGEPRQTWPLVTGKLLDTLSAAGVPAVGFVNGKKLVDEAGSPEPWRADLLREWLSAGLELGNHTYSHPSLHNVALDAFLEDVRKNDLILRPIVEAAGGELRYFRHPYLHTGRDEAARQAVAAVLEEQGYRVAPVTIDSAEWIFAFAYAKALEQADAATAGRIAAAYLGYMEAKVDYWERQSRLLLGREVRQVLLLHANALNADTLEQLLAMLQRRGYGVVTLGQVLADDVYTLADGYWGPAGISWLHRWCFTLGGYHLLLPDEPRCPPWVMQLAGVDSE